LKVTVAGAGAFRQSGAIPLVRRYDVIADFKRGGVFVPVD
jgi:hypothetical protein